MSRPPPAGPLLVALLVGAALGTGVFWYLAPTAGRNAAPPNDPAAQPRAAAPKSPLDADEAEAVNLFKGARDSVVNVDTVRLVRRLDSQIEARQTGTGSGFVWDQDGRIVTNFHVVKEAVAGGLQVRVVLADRTTYDAAVVGAAPDYDLAVVQIDAPRDKLKPLAVGTSGDLQVGQKVYAIGNPFGLSLTMTKGIISALDREIESLSDRPISGAIQTDAPINPGNSGGPLLDKDGRLVGVNTAIAGPGGGNVGIGFAIPVDTVNAVVPELIRTGRVRRPDLGVRFVDERRVRRAGFKKGVMIQDVLPNGPAARAGLQGVTGDGVPGDLILAVNGEDVKGVADYARALAKYKPGDAVKLTLDRRDETVEVEVTLRGV